MRHSAFHVTYTVTTLGYIHVFSYEFSGTYRICYNHAISHFYILQSAATSQARAPISKQHVSSSMDPSKSPPPLHSPPPYKTTSTPPENSKAPDPVSSTTTDTEEYARLIRQGHLDARKPWEFWKDFKHYQAKNQAAYTLLAGRLNRAAPKRFREVARELGVKVEGDR